MNIEPLPRKIYNRAIAAGVNIITLNFSGGSDEGYLNITLNEGLLNNQELEDEIENWAWEVYDYSGAGDGNDYGDDITYDLQTMKATHSDWCMERQDGAETDDSFELADDEEEDEEEDEVSSQDAFVKRVRALVERVAELKTIDGQDSAVLGAINEAYAITQDQRWEEMP